MSNTIVEHCECYEEPVPSFAKDFMEMFRREWKTITLSKYLEKAEKTYNRYKGQGMGRDSIMLDIVYSVIFISQILPGHRTKDVLGRRNRRLNGQERVVFANLILGEIL